MRELALPLGPLPRAWVAESAPGTWLRLTALGGTIATGLVVATGPLHLGMGHNALVAPALAPLVALELAAVLTHRRLLRLATAALLLMLVEIALGGLLALTNDARWAVGLHLAAAALAFTASALATAATFRVGGTAVAAPASNRDYLELTKPRVMTLLLLTGLCSMFVGAVGVPSARAIVALLIGLALACGGAGTLNHVMDAEIDRKMGPRTSSRPVAGGRIAASRAVDFGLALSTLSFVVLSAAANVPTALFGLTGIVFYVLVYGWLKRTTLHNTVIGGAAGAIPVLVGWAAATGSMNVNGLLLFLIVFVWQPPHFWALSLMIKDYYAAAGIPMLPVVRGDRATTKQILIWTVGLVPVTVLPVVTGSLSWLYLGCALVLDALFLAYAIGLRRHTSRRTAATTFHFSLLYLALLFVAAAVDAVVF